MNNTDKPIVIIAGPTASGKTALAVALAKKYHGEVINADSRSVYKEMDLGTAKPTSAEMSGIPHHLLDLLYPDETFSVALFKQLAKEKILEIHKRGNIPFLVGGTGLYLDSVAYDYQFSAATADTKYRDKMEAKTLEEIYSLLLGIDKDTAEAIGKQNKRRLIRALEVHRQTGSGKLAQETKKTLPENILYLALDTPREKLYENINKRVDKIVANGFENEVKRLVAKYPADSPALDGIGYKQFIKYLGGEITLDEAIEKFKQGDRNLAKRQLTWLRRNQDVVWISSLAETTKAVSQFLLRT